MQKSHIANRVFQIDIYLKGPVAIILRLFGDIDHLVVTFPVSSLFLNLAIAICISVSLSKPGMSQMLLLVIQVKTHPI